MSEPAQQQPITLSSEDGGFVWTVRCGDRYSEHLSCDETLWVVARLLMRHSAGLRTKEEHELLRAAMDATFGKELAAWQKQLAPPEVAQ